MRKIITVFILVFLSVSISGQTVQKERKVVQVIGKSAFVLNSGNKTSFGFGINKGIEKISLPPNTVEWCYIFRTKNTNSSSNTTIFDMIIPSEITFAKMVINVISGTGGVCNVFLTDEVNAKKFKQNKPFDRNINYDKIQHSEGFVIVRDFISDDIYLCFYNPNSVYKVEIEYEVIAIVEE